MLGKLPVPGRPTDLDYSRARAYCACGRCGCGRENYNYNQPLVRFVGILMLDGDLDLGPVTGTYYSHLTKKKTVIYRQLRLVYLIKLVESLDTMFRLQDIKV